MSINWKPELSELSKRQKLGEKMGGAAKLKRQKERGKFNVRQRMDLLLDEGSFREIGKIAGKGTYLSLIHI